MKASALPLIMGCMLLAGCSAGSSLSTGSLFGGSASATPAAPVAAPVTVSDPTSRAFQVGTVSARAVKCGYNFDPAKLRASFLAYEVGSGLSSADVPRVEQIYDVSYNGVVKATATDKAYCTEARTKEIKTDLTRHLAGDYTPTPRKPVVAESGGLFGDWGSSSSGTDSGSKFKHPMDNL